MKPPELIEVLKKLDPDKEILCQVIAKNGGAWMMHFSFSEPPNVSFNVLTVSHPDLKTLPKMDQQQTFTQM